MRWKYMAVALAASLALAACDAPPELPPDPPPIGDFRLGHTKVSAKGSVVPDISRKVEPEVLQQALSDALEERLGRYKGNKWYHLTVALEGYVLSPPGIPVIASPRSGMVLRVVVWDDTAGAPLNEPHQLTIVEPTSPETVVGSGIARDAEQQLRALSRHAARVIENWLKSPESSPLPGIGPGG
ncbi:MAG: hypothetical protein OXF74_01515 [Rhodobacteraceae bacterium]|nr:hypothetical protein [Paracoccaceae bacterium]